MINNEVSLYVTKLINEKVDVGEMDYIVSKKLWNLTYKYLAKWSKINKKLYGSCELDSYQITQTIQFVRSQSTIDLLNYLVVGNKITINISKDGKFVYRPTKKGLKSIRLEKISISI